MTIYKIASGIRLWLDDNRDPKDPKIQQLFGAKGDEVWVKTVSEAKDHILHSHVGFISFDNDLGLEEEGSDLASWIEEMAYYKKLSRIEWTVHSRNAVESKNIYMAMMNADKFWEEQEKTVRPK